MQGSSEVRLTLHSTAEQFSNMQNLADEIRDRMPTLRNVETRVQSRDGTAFVERRTEQGGFSRIENPEPRTESCRGFVYDFKPDMQMAELCPGLFLGSQDVASSRELLDNKGVTHIINAATAIPNHFPDDYKYKRVEILDVPEQDIRSHFVSCIDFIDDAIATGGAVLVHCNAGVSRSCSICLAYLISRKQMKLNSALKHVRSIRPFVRPNDGFLDQLKAFETEVHGSPL